MNPKRFLNFAIQYISLQSEIKHLTVRKNDLNGKIKTYIHDNGYTDERGHVYVDLDGELELGDRTIRKLKNERHVTPEFQEDKAEKLLETKGLKHKVIKTIEVYDWDELYVLNQQGLVTDAELDSLFENKVSWNLVIEK